MKQNSKIVVYLDRQKIYLCRADLPQCLTLDLPQNIVHDIDVADPDSLESLLLGWLEQNKINSTDAIIILSPSTYFEKDGSPPTDPVQKKSLIDAFTQTIPFTNLFTKDYSLEKKSKIIALNRDFYEPFIRFFEKKQFNIIAVIPGFILDLYHLSIANFTGSETQMLFKKVRLLLPHSLITAQEIDKSYSPVGRKPTDDRPHTRLLIAAFCLLWVVLIALLYNQSQSARRQPPKPIVTPKVTIPTPTPEITPTPNYLPLENIRVKIINGSGVTGSAGKVKDALTAVGLIQITTSTSTRIAAASNQIVFFTQISPEIRQVVTQMVQKTAGISSQKDTLDSSASDIIITLTSLPR